MAFFGEHFGLRATSATSGTCRTPTRTANFDLDFGNVDYWRAVGGITFRF
jgi:hypothetical protein